MPDSRERVAATIRHKQGDDDTDTQSVHATGGRRATCPIATAKLMVFSVRPLQSLLAAWLCCGAGGALALTFTKALELARLNDPAYLSAQANYQAAQERSTIAISALRPQISFAGNAAQNDRRYVTKSTILTPETVRNQQFSNSSAQINLTQALWRRAERIGVTQAGLAAQQVENQVVVAEHDLFVRFLQAWFDLMSARDNIAFTATQSGAAAKLREQTTRAAELGLASEPEVEDALARFERALAERAAAAADQQDKLSSLEQIIGAAPTFDPPALAKGQAASNAPDQPLERWLELAEQDNPTIIAATFGSRAAIEEVRRQMAGHQPTLDLTASYGRTGQGVGTTPLERGYSNTQASIGLQLNIPMYSGGAQSAKVREAIALQEKAAQDLEAVRRTVRSACKQAWFGIQSAMAREKSAAQALKSALAGIRLATTGKQRELKTDLDVLQATQQMVLAQRDLQTAGYLVMLNKIKLRAAAGQLTAADVVALDAAFVPSAPGPESVAQRSPGSGP